ncbi:MAG: YtxH domain-containing protein, partial [Bacteroidetes bacterium]|nr:YtxH domain-containing protein [Bacteroidota bacterium]
MKKSTTSFFTGLISGVAIGAVLGILYAPDKGVNTRKKINKKAGEIKDDINKKIDDIKHYAEDAVGDIKEKVSEAK